MRAVKRIAVASLVVVVLSIGLFISPLALDYGLWLDPDAFANYKKFGDPKPVPELSVLGTITLPAFLALLLSTFALIVTALRGAAK